MDWRSESSCLLQPWDPQHGLKLLCCAKGIRAVPQGSGPCWHWDPSWVPVLGCQPRSGVGISARIWCWKPSWVLVLGSHTGSGAGIPARIWCWDPIQGLMLGSQPGFGAGSPAGCQLCVSDQRLQRWRKKTTPILSPASSVDICQFLRNWPP